MSFFAQRFDRVGGEQAVARGRDHHGIEHDVLRRPARQSGGDDVDAGGLRHHANLDGADGEIGKHRIDLRCNEFRRHIVDRVDPLGVLRGERSDDRRAIDPERGKCLQIRLDAGGAAGIGARDGDGDRGHARTRFANAASTIPRIRSAAVLGSGTSDNAEITETPSAPAAITSAALPSLMPAIPQVGKSGLRR